MASIDDALAAATVDETAEEYLIIDNDLRTITIPDSVKLLGVESDAGVRRLKFKMPATYGEFDLSSFGIRINYLNSSPGDMYVVDDAIVQGDTIIFSWLVGRNACMYKGSTRFIVCLKLTDSDGVVTKEFNTTVASLPVLEGLETTEQVVQDNPDVIEQILAMIGTGGSGSASVKIDDTLSKSGYAADAAAAGEAVTDVRDTLDEVYPERVCKNLLDPDAVVEGHTFSVNKTYAYLPAVSTRSISGVIYTGGIARTYVTNISSDYIRFVKYAKDGTYISANTPAKNAAGLYQMATDTDVYFIRVAWEVASLAATIDNCDICYLEDWTGTHQAYVREPVYIDRLDVLNSNLSPEVLDTISGGYKLSGVSIMTLGDSIMAGNGNDYVGIGEIIQSRHDNVTLYDYSRDGATLAWRDDTSFTTDDERRRNIQYQVGVAIEEVTEQPDYILIDGYVNDIVLGLDTGTFTSSFTAAAVKDTTTYGGMDYILGTLKRVYPLSKIIYIRAHCIGSIDFDEQVARGAACIEVANKWGVSVVNLFSGSGFNTFLDDYLTYTSTTGGTHPTGEGYDRFYIPYIEHEMINPLTKTDVQAPSKDTSKTLQPLTFDGAVSASYDGSGAVTVTIPDDKTYRVAKTAEDTTVELEPGKLYVFPEISSLTYTLAAGADDVVDEYHFIFESGATATEVVHPAEVNVGDLTVAANKVYEISVVEGLLAYKAWEATA